MSDIDQPEQSQSMSSGQKRPEAEDSDWWCEYACGCLFRAAGGFLTDPTTYIPCDKHRRDR